MISVKISSLKNFTERSNTSPKNLVLDKREKFFIVFLVLLLGEKTSQLGTNFFLFAVSALCIFVMSLNLYASQLTENVCTLSQVGLNR